MKALLIKDLYVVNKQLRLYLLILVVFIAFNRDFGSIFLPVWCSMLPYTAMAYDERSHWNQLAAMMPYSKRDIVLSKYVLGWLCMAASGVFCLAVQAAAGIVSGSAPSVPTLLASLCLGIITLDITLPAVLRFGVERGRMIFMVVIFGVAISIGILVDMVDELPSLPVPLVVLLPLGAAAGTALSIPLSMKLYKEN